jgi:hypothetical protein
LIENQAETFNVVANDIRNVIDDTRMHSVDRNDRLIPLKQHPVFPRIIRSFTNNTARSCEDFRGVT